MLVTAAIFSIISLVTATDKLYAKIEQRLKTIAKENNVSDDKIIIRELNSFFHDNGPRRQNDEKDALRADPPLRQLKLKVVDMMRQAIYGTQGRVKELDPILQKYKDDTALKMNFIMNRLGQLMLDIKRIYTVSIRRRRRRVFNQTAWYVHCMRKFFDILYTVEYAIEEHDNFMKQYGQEIGAYGGQG